MLFTFFLCSNPLIRSVYFIPIFLPFSSSISFSDNSLVNSLPVSSSSTKIFISFLFKVLALKKLSLTSKTIFSVLAVLSTSDDIFVILGFLKSTIPNDDISVSLLKFPYKSSRVAEFIISFKLPS